METGDQNVPIDWIIEFSDPIFGNRWQKDEIKLEVAGRNCPLIVNSQHDRRFVFQLQLNMFFQIFCLKARDHMKKYVHYRNQKEKLSKNQNFFSF